jgi:hypothetical protein
MISFFEVFVFSIPQHGIMLRGAKARNQFELGKSEFIVYILWTSRLFYVAIKGSFLVSLAGSTNAVASENQTMQLFDE